MLDRGHDEAAIYVRYSGGNLMRRLRQAEKVARGAATDRDGHARRSIDRHDCLPGDKRSQVVGALPPKLRSVG